LNNWLYKIIACCILVVTNICAQTPSSPITRSQKENLERFRDLLHANANTKKMHHGKATVTNNDTNVVSAVIDHTFIGVGFAQPISFETQQSFTLSAVCGADKIEVLEVTGVATNVVVLPKRWSSGELPRLLLRGVALSGAEGNDVILRAEFEPDKIIEVTNTVVQCAVIAWAEQAVPGQRKVFVLQNGKPNIGHSGWHFVFSHPALLPKEMQECVNVPCGFMRDPHASTMTLLNLFTPTPGKFILNDAGESRANVSHTFSISPAQLLSGMQWTVALRKKPRDYVPAKFNCTDAAIAACASAGVLLPRTLGEWPGGAGANPGDFGEDLKLLTN